MRPFYPTKPDKYFTFGGISSEAFYTWISGTGTYDAPERDVTTVSIPGRSGDLLLDNGRFKNIKLTYPCFIPRGFNGGWFDDLKAWLLSDTNYKRLEDSYHPDHFRMAYCIGPIKPKTGPENMSGSFNVTFVCKPQRWLKEGERWFAYTASTAVNNPTMYPAKPIIRIRGTGAVTIGDITMTVTSQPDADPYIDVDCDLQDCYHGSNNRNANVVIIGDFPTLDPGLNALTIGSGITSVQIMPRWWTI